MSAASTSTPPTALLTALHQRLDYLDWVVSISPHGQEWRYLTTPRAVICSLERPVLRVSTTRTRWTGQDLHKISREHSLDRRSSTLSFNHDCISSLTPVSIVLSRRLRHHGPSYHTSYSTAQPQRAEPTFESCKPSVDSQAYRSRYQPNHSCQAA